MHRSRRVSTARRLVPPALRALSAALAGAFVFVLAACDSSPPVPAAQAATAVAPARFEIVEARIADIQGAIKSHQLTATQLVDAYLARIKAYNGACVKEPNGLLGRIETIDRKSTR